MPLSTKRKTKRPAFTFQIQKPALEKGPVFLFSFFSFSERVFVCLMVVLDRMLLLSCPKPSVETGYRFDRIGVSENAI